MTSPIDPPIAPPATPPGATQVKYPPPPPESPGERKGRMIALFVLPFLMVTMMYATYLGTMHSPKAQDLPVAVAGHGVAAQQFADQLERGADGALEVRVVKDKAAVEKLIEDQKIAGAIQLPTTATEGATIYRASASGASQASLVDTMLLPAAAAQGWQVHSEDLHPLNEGDGTGTMVLFAAMGMMLAGYVPLSGMLSGLPNLLRWRRFLPICVAWGAATSSLIWLILGPIVGAVDGHYPLFLAVGTLAVTAVGVSQLLFTKVIGALAVLLGMLLWVVFGVPSSNLAMSIHQMPGFFEWLHGVLPLPAAGEAIRSAIYFGGNGFWRHILTLGLWVVIPLALAILKERKSGPLIAGGPLYTEPDAPLPALAGGPVAGYRMRVVAAILFPLSIVVTVVGLMGMSMHKPDVHDMPVAVVGASAQAEGFVKAVEPKLGEYLDLQVVGSVDKATDLVRSQDVVAAYVLPTAAGQAPTLVTAGGAGASQQTVVTQMFQGIAAASGGELSLKDVAPLSGDDLNGTNAMYAAMGWIMAGFLLFAMLRGGAPELVRTRQLLPLVAGWSVGMSVWLWFLYDVLIGAVNGHPLAMIGYGALTIFAVSWVSSAVIRSVGLGGLVPVMIVVMLAGVPASGGGLSVYMVPELFRSLAEFLPLPAAVDIVRSVLYLDGVGVGHNVLILAIWGVVGLALNFLVVDRWVNRKGARPPAPMGPRYQPERGKKKDPEAEPEAELEKELVSA